MLGLIGILLINTKKISDMVKENIDFTVVIRETVKEADVFKLQKDLDASHYVKSTRYVTKDQAAQDFQKELGEDFVSFLGYNPLLASIEVKLNADYANTDSIGKFETLVKKSDLVKEIHYQKTLVHLINENVSKISAIIMAFCILLFVIAVSLINNTVRLSIYSKRFIINTMQLVGATNSFIRKPFLMRSILQGIVGAGIAICLIILTLFWAEKQLDDLLKLTGLNSVFLLCIALLVGGIIINVISTWFALNKYLRLNTNELYY
jgi:cell division transport system permease protein